MKSIDRIILKLQELLGVVGDVVAVQVSTALSPGDRVGVPTVESTFIQVDFQLSFVIKALVTGRGSALVAGLVTGGGRGVPLPSLGLLPLVFLATPVPPRRLRV